ncbi:hypothetical protein M427DRAFT_492734 [Gonapodya prolifera JEL478]|uniref:Uncharacterized protein n=1 Tax=Gonapodya prolifera (strain JEL478) TaxID=1344416 RepID=A0A139AKV3_GONPJ|nr:hypothetical protein M427DRAFT_492734 [Gonapodya prolifera JEL478]|eukprot:KXS17328.1 hypothetical protein M427DRAFT_492734 [Gonapodya prolifera JEL478]
MLRDPAGIVSSQTSSLSDPRNEPIPTSPSSATTVPAHVTIHQHVVPGSELGIRIVVNRGLGLVLLRSSPSFSPTKANTRTLLVSVHTREKTFSKAAYNSWRTRPRFFQRWHPDSLRGYVDDGIVGLDNSGQVVPEEDIESGKVKVAKWTLKTPREQEGAVFDGTGRWTSSGWVYASLGKVTPPTHLVSGTESSQRLQMVVPLGASPDVEVPKDLAISKSVKNGTHEWFNADHMVPQEKPREVVESRNFANKPSNNPRLNAIPNGSRASRNTVPKGPTAGGSRLISRSKASDQDGELLGSKILSASDVFDEEKSQNGPTLQVPGIRAPEHASNDQVDLLLDPSADPTQVPFDPRMVFRRTSAAVLHRPQMDIPNIIDLISIKDNRKRIPHPGYRLDIIRNLADVQIGDVEDADPKNGSPALIRTSDNGSQLSEKEPGPSSEGAQATTGSSKPLEQQQVPGSETLDLVREVLATLADLVAALDGVSRWKDGLLKQPSVGPNVKADALIVVSKAMRASQLLYAPLHDLLRLAHLCSRPWHLRRSAVLALEDDFALHAKCLDVAISRIEKAEGEAKREKSRRRMKMWENMVGRLLVRTWPEQFVGIAPKWMLEGARYGPTPDNVASTPTLNSSRMFTPRVLMRPEITSPIPEEQENQKSTNMVDEATVTDEAAPLYSTTGELTELYDRSGREFPIGEAPKHAPSETSTVQERVYVAIPVSPSCADVRARNLCLSKFSKLKPSPSHLTLVEFPLSSQNARLMERSSSYSGREWKVVGLIPGSEADWRHAPRKLDSTENNDIIEYDLPNSTFTYDATENGSPSALTLRELHLGLPMTSEVPSFRHKDMSNHEVHARPDSAGRNSQISSEILAGLRTVDEGALSRRRTMSFVPSESRPALPRNNTLLAETLKLKRPIAPPIQNSSLLQALANQSNTTEEGDQVHDLRSSLQGSAILPSSPARLTSANIAKHSASLKQTKSLEESQSVQGTSNLESDSSKVDQPGIHGQKETYTAQEVMELTLLHAEQLNLARQEYDAELAELRDEIAQLKRGSAWSLNDVAIQATSWSASDRGSRGRTPQSGNVSDNNILISSSFRGTLASLGPMNGITSSALPELTTEQDDLPARSLKEPTGQRVLNKRIPGLKGRWQDLPWRKPDFVDGSFLERMRKFTEHRMAIQSQLRDTISKEESRLNELRLAYKNLLAAQNTELGESPTDQPAIPNKTAAAAFLPYPGDVKKPKEARGHWHVPVEMLTTNEKYLADSRADRTHQEDGHSGDDEELSTTRTHVNILNLFDVAVAGHSKLSRRDM